METKLSNFDLQGVGSIREVIVAHMDANQERQEIVSDIQGAYDAINLLLSDERGTRAVDAIACAIINRYFGDGDWLFYVDADSGKIRHNYVTDKMTKGLIAKAIGR